MLPGYNKETSRKITGTTIIAYLPENQANACRLVQKA